MAESSYPMGYAGKFLRVNLTTGAITEEQWDPNKLRMWVGGNGVGARILYDEVDPSIDWSDPENRLIMATGPLAGTSVMGTGAVAFVFKGAMTNGATTTQANGFMGAFMKFAGYDAVIVQGQSPKWVYLHLHDGVAELKDAEQLLGLGTYELQTTIAEEVGKKERLISMMGIGPAGEKLVRFAAIGGDRGHIASHNGGGAVMGSKRLKAIVAERGKNRFPVADDKGLKERAKLIVDEILAHPVAKGTYEWGTQNSFANMVKTGVLPVKNYTTNLFPEPEKFMRQTYQQEWELEPMPCWACRTKHLHDVTIRGGKWDGFKTEEPEYEQWAAWGPQIGNEGDAAGAAVLSNDVDRLGVDTNEAGWVVGWVMECYEKGIVTKEELGGLEMTWGNVEATRQLLEMIAHRQGFGDLLAEGVKRASEKLGRGSQDLAIYNMKGNSPRGHDHRSRWIEMVDTCISDTGTIEVGPAWIPQEQGAKANPNLYDWQDIAEQLGKHNGRMMFEDSLGICRFTSRTSMEGLGKAVELSTGWEGFTGEEALAVGRRISNLLRVYNLRAGLTPDMERPSRRYGSIPVDGPLAGKNVMENWDDMRMRYYELMGWDKASGRPLPETLGALGLDDVGADAWPELKR
ncbi:MAG TPA: aldehyde ferredoxin oxidoreductase C-terminal domain-containing protein [Chloroflexota bacterium]|nr:aldehyde ferredoxin oxidoreductase C-terminal domain-containing protein [Chloroflexota bacterium]